MVSQRDVILSIFYLKKKVWGRTYLQKLIYLLNREIFDDELFDYDFYKYGPYCAEINEELTDLDIEGVIDERAVVTKGYNTAYTYELTPRGKQEAMNVFFHNLPVELKDNLVNYVNEFGNMTPTQLLRYVYAKYPEVTENSIYEEN